MCRGEEWSRVVAVTNRHLAKRPYEEQIERICRLGPAAVIVREKDLLEETYADLAGRVKTICESYGVPCIYHTYLVAARQAGARRLHLPLALLRYWGGDQSWRKDFDQIGASVHSVEEAREAAGLGADYLAAGHLYVTDCKKGLAPRGIQFLREVCQAVPIPVYGIGGIHPGAGQVEEVCSCGAAGACIMSGMMVI